MDVYEHAVKVRVISADNGYGFSHGRLLDAIGADTDTVIVFQPSRPVHDDSTVWVDRTQIVSSYAG